LNQRTGFSSPGRKLARALALMPLVAAPSMAQEGSVQATQIASIKAQAAVVARAYAKPDPAASLPGIAPKVHFEAVNPGEPAGDRLGPARRLAAAIVAQDKPAPHSIVDVGSFTGEFLEAFMQRFPDAHGQWTEPVTGNEDNAKMRLQRFGKNVDYVIGCANRDISQGCLPKGMDVLITSWLSIHQDLAGIRKFYKEAADKLPSGGWLVNLDHVSYGKSAWTQRVAGARDELASSGINAIVEGPPVHHADFVTPSIDAQLAALKDAGFTDVNVVWRRLDTVLFMARKN
jgi:SAM-dependent methyltransferase